MKEAIIGSKETSSKRVIERESHYPVIRNREE
jgi:hypothetical protein